MGMTTVNNQLCLVLYKRQYEFITFPFSEWRKQIDEALRIFSVLGANSDYERLVENGANKIKTHLDLAFTHQSIEI